MSESTVPGAEGPAAARAPSTTEGPQPATDPSPGGVVERRRRAVAAGHRQQRDEALALVTDDEPAVRAAALGALARAGGLDRAVLARSMADPDPGVRRRACHEAGRQLSTDGRGQAIVVELLVGRLDDPEPAVAEAAAWALGEAGVAGIPAGARLVAMARSGPALCREAAVAALGAMGCPEGLPAVLEALEDRPALRRRAAVALAGFDDPAAEDGLRRAASDRDWQVRQIAEELLGGD